MEVLTGPFIFGLYKATEKIWEKGFDAAWEPVGEALKERFTCWAGRHKASAGPPSSKPTRLPQSSISSQPGTIVGCTPRVVHHGSCLK